MRTTAWLMAGALAFGTVTAALSQGRSGTSTGSTGSPGASEYAPGQIKKQPRTQSQSAKKYARGQNTVGKYNTPSGQRAR